MQEIPTTRETKRMPTGISSLDPILDGGIPPGTMTLLLGEIGAGHNEFVYSSTVSSLSCMVKPGETGKIRPARIV